MSTQFTLHLWAQCCRNVSFPGRDSGEKGPGCWDPSTMTTFKMSHTRVRYKDNDAAICITECALRRRHLTPLFSVSGMPGILAWPFDCKKKHGSLSEETEGHFGSWEWWSGILSLWCLWAKTMRKVGVLLWWSLSIWLIIRTLCATEMQKKRKCYIKATKAEW